MDVQLDRGARGRKREEQKMDREPRAICAVLVRNRMGTGVEYVGAAT